MAGSGFESHVGHGMWKRMLYFSVLLSLLFYHPLFSVAHFAGVLHPGHYRHTCPNVASIVKFTFKSLAEKNIRIAPGILRLIFHDCFVHGCDASILLESTPGNIAEKDTQGVPQIAFDAINTIKEAVERECPEVVSCADILALTSRDSVEFLGGPYWVVPLGRRDGRISIGKIAEKEIPKPNATFHELISSFSSKNLDLLDLVALSGAHTVGFSKCNAFSDRFENRGHMDSLLDPFYAKQLNSTCRGDGLALAPLDPSSPFVFDSSYFKNLQMSRGLLHSDEVLFTKRKSRGLVDVFAYNQPLFFHAFVRSMIRLTSLIEIDDNAGEIRRNCSVVNSRV